MRAQNNQNFLNSPEVLNCRRRLSGGLIASLAAFALVLWFALLPLGACGQYNPVAFYKFDGPPYGADASGNLHNFVNTVGMQYGGTAPQLIDSFLQVNVLTQVPFALPLDATHPFREITMEFWFRRDKDFFQGRMAIMSGLAYFDLSEMALDWVVFLQGGGQQLLHVPFYGAGVTDAHNLLDGGWHHVAGCYDVKTGTQRLYIDGYNAPGMTLHHGTSPPMVQSAAFLPYGSNSDGICDLDEMAVYDTVLPPDLIWQHAYNGALGLAYSNVVDPAGPMAPHPQNVAQGGIDTLEFCPGYPATPVQTPDLLAGYPAPRYRPGHAMPRLIPWIGESYSLANNLPMPYPNGGPNMLDMLARLANDYNYYLHVGITSDYKVINQNTESYYYQQAGNAAANSGLPRFVINNWRHVQPRDTLPFIDSTCYILNQTLPFSYYLRNMLNQPLTSYYGAKRWNWAAASNPGNTRMLLIDRDGATSAYYLSLVNQAIPHPVAMVGENEETLIAFDSTDVDNDPEMSVDRANTGLIVGQYQSLRARQFRRRFSDHYMNYQNGRPYQQDSLQLYWYNVGGNEGISGFRYDSARAINRFADGIPRGSDYWYPQSANLWRYGGGAVTGLRHIVLGRRPEILSGDRRFMPSVSPGFSQTGGGWFTGDRIMLRPAQFLGCLKALGMMGADGYSMFMTHGDALSLVPMQGSWRAWQPAMPAYAQAVTERLGTLLSGGYLLDGDLGVSIMGNVQTGNYFTFSTGNPLDLIVGRKADNAARYALHGSIMRLVNTPSQAPKEKDVCICLADSNGTVVDTLLFKIRAQGSTYILDLTGADTVFYQLDGWHEWTEPWRWCRDFVLEGELADAMPVGPSVIGTTHGGSGADFREFNSWATIDSGQQLDYQFTTRHQEQDTLYCWVRGRHKTAAGTTVQIVLNGNAQGAPVVLPVGNFGWTSVPVVLDLPQRRAWDLNVVSNDNGIQIDKVLLARSPQPFVGAAFLPRALVEDSVVCLGDSAHFHVGGLVPSGCLDYRWDFGDGNFAYSADPAHLYAYPDTYQVVLAVHHACLDSTAWDTVTVVIDAPHVEAGRDTFMCAGDTLQLQGEGSYFFKWREDALVSSPIVQQPMAWPQASGYLHIDGWDPLTGCHASDSVYVTLVTTTHHADTTIHVCTTFLPQNYVPTQIGVSGGYFVWWAPDAHLSSTTVRNPTLSGSAPLGILNLTAYLSDFCRCDTDTVVVHIVRNTFSANAVTASPDTVCEGQSIQLNATGLLAPHWTAPAGGWIDNPATWNPHATCTAQGANAFGPQQQVFTVSGHGCGGGPVTGSVTVTVVPQSFLGNGNLRDTTWVCQGGTIGGLGLDQTRPAPSGYQWQPASAFVNPTVLMPTLNASVTVPTAATLTLYNSLGCPHVYNTLLMPMGLLPDSVYQCPGGSVGVGVSAGFGAGMASAGWTPAAWFSNSSVPVTTVSVPSTQTVYVDYSYGTCGLMHDSLRVVVHGLPQIAADTLRACIGDTVPLLATGAAPVQWGIDGGMVGDSTAPMTWTLFGTQPFTLYVASCDSFFCPGFDSVVVAGRDVLPGPDTLFICLGDTVTLSSMAGGISCLWSPNQQIDTVTNCTVHVWPNGDGWYKLDWTDATGCHARDSVWIDIDSVSITGMLLSLADTICYTDSLQLQATGGSIYAWSPAGGLSNANVASPWAHPAVTTVYHVRISNGGACVVEDSVEIVVDVTVPNGILTVDDDTVCNGQAIVLASGGGTGHVWSGPGITGLSADTLTLVPAGTSDYSVVVGDSGTCVWMDTVHVLVDSLAPPAIVLTPDSLICTGMSLTLNCAAFVGGNYIWTPGGATTPSVAVAPTATTLYHLTVGDGGGCLGHDSVLVTVQSCCSLPGVTRYVRPHTAASPFSLIPANGGAIHIVDTLFVNSAFVTYTGKTFYMDSAAVIYVQPGCTLNTTACMFRSACGDMWADIGVTALNARFVTTTDTVRDALRGVWSRNGGAFTIDRTRFSNNYIGLQVEDYYGAAHPGSVKGSSFLSGPTPPVPVGIPTTYPKGYAGIVVRDVQNFRIGFPDVNAATENVFVGMVHGIYAYHSRIDVYHNRFQDIVPPLIPIGVGQYCGVSAIGDAAVPANYALNVGHPSTVNGPLLSQYANKFSNCTEAVFVDQAMTVNVRGNTISSSAQYGVFVRALRANLLRVERNTIAASGVAVWVGTSTQVDGTVSNNVISNTSPKFGIGGIRIDNMAYGNMLPGVYPLQVRDNSIDVHGNGIYLNASYGVNVENNSILIRRVNATENLYGIFAGSNTRIRIANNPDIHSMLTGITNERTAGIYVARSRENIVLCNSVRDMARSVVFVGDCMPTDFLGNTMKNGVDGFVMLNHAAIGNQGQDVAPGQAAIPCANTWLGTFTNSWTNAINSFGDSSRFYVRTVPSQNPQPSVNLPLNDPLRKMHPAPVGNGNMSAVNCSSMMPGNETSGVIKNIALNRQSGDSLTDATQFRADEWAYTALLKEPMLAASDPVIQAYQDSAMGSSMAASSNANELLTVPDSLQAAMAASRILPQSASEVNHRDVLSIRLDGEGLNPREEHQLYMIAMQCEALGGKAVNIARGLLASQGILIWDDPDCQGVMKIGGHQLQGNEIPSVHAECWPNPSSGRIFLRFDHLNLAGTLRLFDAQGRQLATELFDYQGQALEFDAGKWCQGLVVVKVSLHDGTQFSWRVVVQR